MTYTDEQVAQWFMNILEASDGSQIAQGDASVRGGRPEQVARVTGADPGYVALHTINMWTG
jgi:hypothetical protein